MSTHRATIQRANPVTWSGMQGLTTALSFLGYVYFFGPVRTVWSHIHSSAAWLVEGVAFSAMLVVVGILVGMNFGAFKRALRGSTLVFAFCALALLSCLWSAMPAVTMVEALQLIPAAVFGVVAAVQLNSERHLHVLTLALLAIAVSSAALALLVPSRGLMTEDYPGAWRGAYSHKNQLSQVMALGAICGTIGILHRRHWKSSTLLLFASLVLVILSRSKGGLLLVLLAWAALVPLRLLQLRPDLFRRWCAGAVLLLGVLALWELSLGTLLPPIMDAAKAAAHAMGKDLTITGRDVIWRASVAAVMDRPVLGYGFSYQSFWSEVGTGAWIWEAAGWEVPQAHSGYLELWLGLGLAGFTLYALIFGRLLGRTMVFLARSGTWVAMVPALAAMLIAIFAFTETIFFRSVEQVWFVIVVWGSHLPRREKRRADPFMARSL